jgi:hypothetical protein
MDNEKDAEIIPFPNRRITLKQARKPIFCLMHEEIKRKIDVAETDRLYMVKLNITGEIEITTGNKKFIKEVDVFVNIDIDPSED